MRGQNLCWLLDTAVDLFDGADIVIYYHVSAGQS